MRVNVTADEALLLHRTLAFANLKTIRSTKQVERLFDLPIVARPFKILRPGEQAAYQDNQRDLRRWLEVIAAGRGHRVLGEVAELLKVLPAGVTLDAQRREVVAVYQVQGIRDCYALATAWLLSKSRGLGPRLGYCDAPGCERFRLDLTPRGRPRRYCNVEHRRQADARKVKARVQRWRKKHLGWNTRNVGTALGNER